LRIGYGLGHPDLIASLEKVRQPFNINSPAQHGAMAALDDDEHLQRTRQNNLNGLNYLEQALREMRLRFVPSSANFILVKVGDGQRIFTELQKLGVIVRPMAGYQLPEFIRISVGTPAENARCIDALRLALSQPHPK
jgi:histidinol-phosphate aminotransferase